MDRPTEDRADGQMMLKPLEDKVHKFVHKVLLENQYLVSYITTCLFTLHDMLKIIQNYY